MSTNDWLKPNRTEQSNEQTNYTVSLKQYALCIMRDFLKFFLKRLIAHRSAVLHLHCTVLLIHWPIKKHASIVDVLTGTATIAMSTHRLFGGRKSNDVIVKQQLGQWHAYVTGCRASSATTRETWWVNSVPLHALFTWQSVDFTIKKITALEAPIKTRSTLLLRGPCVACVKEQCCLEISPLNTNYIVLSRFS